MKTSDLLKAIGAAVICGAMLLSCQGRKMDNMTPDGDTVEVTPDVQTIASDSIR